MSATRKPIFTIKMARYLIDRGFEPVETRPNPKDLHKDVWLFARTPELDAACDEYIAASRQSKIPAIPNVSNHLIAKMHLDQGMPIEAIATITHKTVDKIKEIINSEIDLYRLFAIAAMNDTELKQLMSAQDDDERNRLIVERMRRGGFTAYGAKSTYEFPAAKTVREGVSEDA